MIQGENREVAKQFGYVNFVEEKVKQRSLEKVEQKWEKLTFDRDSTLDWSLVAAEHDGMNSVHIGKQSQEVERKEKSIHGTKWVNSEIDQFDLGEEFGSFPTIQMKDSNCKESYIQSKFIDEAVNQRNLGMVVHNARS
jgi:hypothetical protein